MAKSLDGIKKLNPADLKKYRKMVLNYIGEEGADEVREPKDFIKGAVASRKVDGINVNKISKIDSQGINSLKYLSAKGGRRSGLFSGQAGVVGGEKVSAAKRSREDTDFGAAIKRQAEERKRVEVEEKNYQLQQEQAAKDRKDREEKDQREKIKLEKEGVKQVKIAKDEAEQLAHEQAKRDRQEQEGKVKQEKIRQEEIKKQQQELVEKRRCEQAEAVRLGELKKKEIIEQAKREAEETRRVEEMKKQAEIIRLDKLAKEEKRRIQENLRLERIKREAEIKSIGQEVALAKQAAREKKKIKQQKARKIFKRKFNLQAQIYYSVIKRNFIYIILITTLGLAIIYVIFCSLVLRLKVGNNFIISQTLRYIPVPAVITNQGMISYSDFQKIENNNYLSLNLAEKKNYLAEWLILRDLEKKYGLATNSSIEDSAIKYALDQDFNQSGISRINKINELLNGQNAFEQSGRYADEYNEGAYYDANSAVEKFGSKVLELTIGQTSNIITRADGYYIIKRIDDKNGQLGLKYIFIGARTLDQYVSEKLEKIKVFILAN